MSTDRPEQPGGGMEFPQYFDPDREAKARAREEADAAARGETPAARDASPDPGAPGAAPYRPPFEPYQPGGERDGAIEVDEWGNPVDPSDPDLIDAFRAAGMTEEEARAEARAATSAQQQSRIRATGFPFPGFGGTTRGGLQWRVGGCCLPIPLLLGTVGLAALRALR